jgi:hypothetical protein
MSSGGFERNDEKERAATAKGYLAMRVDTRERMISIMDLVLLKQSTALGSSVHNLLGSRGLH